MRTAALVLTLALTAPLPAAAQDLRLVARAPGGEWTTGPIQARLGEAVEVRAALLDRDGRLLADVPAVRWEGRLRRAAGPLPAGAEVRFRRVEPRMVHVETAPPNAGIPSFSNAVLTGPEHGRWLGYDTLEYEERALEQGAGIELAPGLARIGAAHPSEARRDRHDGAGSMWLSAELVLPDGRTQQAPGARDADRFGLARTVLRVSFRAGDDYLGWLSTYFNVPTVFGSSGPGRDHQTDRYVGADCADVLVGALRAMGAPTPYVSVAGLSRVAAPVGGVLVLREDGRVVDAQGGEARLAWGRDVMPGDLVAIGYVHARELPRSWDHVGALVRDGGPDGRADGVLGGDDVLRHMTDRGLDDRALGREGVIRMRIWRLTATRRPRGATRR